MKLWASSESCTKADSGLDRARRYIEPYLRDYLSKSTMSGIDLTIRYVPMVMPKYMHDIYKERSKAKIKQNIYECALYLDYDVFISNNFDARISEYVRGISRSAPHLTKFGLSLEQISEFRGFRKRFENVIQGAARSNEPLNPQLLMVS